MSLLQKQYAEPPEVTDTSAQVISCLKYLMDAVGMPEVLTPKELVEFKARAIAYQKIMGPVTQEQPMTDELDRALGLTVETIYTPRRDFKTELGDCALLQLGVHL